MAETHLRVAKSKTLVWFVTLNFPARLPPWIIHLSAMTAALLCVLKGGGEPFVSTRLHSRVVRSSCRTC